jgi:hypothetical protein
MERSDFDAFLTAATPAAESTPPKPAPAAPVEAPAPAPAAKPAPATSTAPSGPSRADRDAAARRRRREEEARRRDAAAAQEALGPQMVPYGDPATAAFMKTKVAETVPLEDLSRAYVLNMPSLNPFPSTAVAGYLREKEQRQEGVKQQEQMEQLQYERAVYQQGLDRAELALSIPDPEFIPENIKNKDMFKAAYKTKQANIIIDQARKLADLGTPLEDIVKAVAGTAPTISPQVLENTLMRLTLPKLERPVMPREAMTTKETVQAFYGGAETPLEAARYVAKGIK